MSRPAGFRLVGTILDLAVSATPNRIAATLGERAVTFAEIDRSANRMARALRSLGVGRHGRVLFRSRLTLATLDLFMATQRIGATFVPLNPALSAEETQQAAAYIRPSLFVADWDQREIAESVGAALALPVAVLGANGRTVPGDDLDRRAAAASDAPLDDATVGEEDIHAIFLTSGSTGRPKGVMLSHRASWLRALLGASKCVTSGGGGELVTFPLFHWAGWSYVLDAWAHRRTVHFVESLDGDRILSEVERWRPSLLYCIPSVWERVLATSHPYDTRSLRSTSTGTSRVDPRLIARIRERFPGSACGVLYGSTEFGTALGLNDSEIDERPGSVGLPAPGKEARIVDGELWLRSDSMMTGYFDLPEQTAEVFRDGWYLSGDLAEQDADGYLTITGRRREVIRSGGETIAPAEVEAALSSYPGLREVAVVGLPDPAWGEVVCAAVTLSPGAACPDVNQLRQHVGSSLAPFKHPRRVIAVESLPRTSATGQIMRSSIRAFLLERQGDA
ncbi:class I adenylate-forming enzyme family protein [Azospirillum soli]|uniref:class I adenylate-forming enzyme family protein n=1 Tax=Azospirillum soli TaxID=1304799 RepID=UPI001AE5A5BD|nr:class I adenylate-forming enzyme family protein [Azospirillum soli]MBP2316603.1 acyl-CoA synthetase (AMP-forming)/AMP-acid ligase II [Azospirillum soli]